MGSTIMAITMTRKKMSMARLGMRRLRGVRVRGVSTDIAADILELIYFEVDLVENRRELIWRGENGLGQLFNFPNGCCYLKITKERGTIMKCKTKWNKKCRTL